MEVDPLPLDSPQPVSVEKGTQHPELNVEDINNNIKYYEDMIRICNQLKNKGALDKGQKIPSPPKVTLKKLLNPKIETSANPEELQSYLEKKLIKQVTETVIPDIKNLAQNATLAMIKPYLVIGSKCLRGKKKQFLVTAMKYGEWLTVAFERFNVEKSQGLVKGSWGNWMKENEIFMSDSYARQLRTIFKNFGDYPKICNLDMSVEELYKNKDKILNLLRFEQNQSFWKTPFTYINSNNNTI